MERLDELKSICERTSEIAETYEESYPSGKRPYEMEKFVLSEKETVWIGDLAKKDDIILEARRTMHCRLVTAVGNMVDKAVREGRLIGVNRNKGE